MKIGPLEYLVLGQKGQGMLKFQYCPKCDKKHDIMTDCVVTKTNIVGKQDNVYAKEVWNEAIEAAINAIRKLKK